MGGSSKQTIGYQYFIGMHQVLCHGPIDKVLQATVDDRLAWKGEATGGTITLPSGSAELFGGTSREGGVSGQIDIAMGGPAQTANAYLQANMDADTPGFRGVVSAIFKQCYLGNNPYLKPWRFRAQRIHVRQSTGIAQWYDEKAEIPSQVDAKYAGFSLVWEMRSSGGSPAVITPAAVQTTTFRSGDAVLYTLPLRVRGLVERRLYPGSTPISGTIVFGGTPGAPTTANIYKLEISNPAQTYYFNAGAFGAGELYNIDATINVQVRDGATVTLSCSTGDDLFMMGNYQFVSVSPADFPYDMNPVHIIRECITDPEWGMGYLEADVGDSFIAAADTIFAEGLGMSLLWDTQIPIGEFIDEVARHIDAAVYVSRTTGKYEIKLIRKDYDKPSLLLLDESNIVKIVDPVKILASELINTVTATYWNSLTGKNSSVTVSDTALVQIQGAMITSPSSYGGFTNARNATIAAQRDLRSLSTSRLSCTVYADPVARTLNIGDVFRLSWTKWNIDDVVMRVTAISYGDGRNNQIRITCTEDVFETTTVQVLDNQVSAWVDPASPPTESTQQRAIEAPYLELVQQRGQGNIDSALEVRPEAGYAMAIASRPGTAINARLASDDGSGYVDVGTLDFCPTGVLVSPITKTQTSFALTSMINKSEIVLGTFFQVDNELMRIDNIDGSNVVTVGRGCLDTVPETHAASAVAYFWDQLSGSDSEEYVLGETINLKVQPISGGGQLALADATALPVTLQQRAYRPYPPGNFQQNATSYTLENINGAIALTWAHRDRKQQTSGTIADHTAGNIGPEAGTTYRVRGYIDSVLVHTEDDIAGTSATWTPVADGAFARVEVHSKRDGVYSLQGPSHSFIYGNENIRVTEEAENRITNDGDLRVLEV